MRVLTSARPRSALNVDGHEEARKLVHLVASIAAAGVASQVPSGPARVLFLSMALVAIGVEIVRSLEPRTGALFLRLFGGMLRGRERRGITGATTLAIGFAAAVLLVPRPFDAVGILVAGIGDAAGALVGRRFGRHPIPGGKSVEGTLACFGAALVTAWAVPGIGLGAAIAVALVTAGLEALPLPIDDNLLLPLASSAAIWAVLPG